MKRTLAATLAAFLLLSAASAAGFSDLPSTHWAYREITRAVSYGILNGLGDGRMNPDGTLTWAHYLAMISRTFAPLSYEGARSAGTDWKTAGYQTALNKGYLRSDDFLNVTSATLDAPISRQDVAVLLSRVLPDADNAPPEGIPLDDSASANKSASGDNANGDASGVPTDSGADARIQVVEDSDGQIWIVIDGVSLPVSSHWAAMDSGADALSDFAQMDAEHQAALRRLYDLGIARGKSDGSFGPYDAVRRCDGAVLLIRTLDAIDELRAGETVSLTFDRTDGDGKTVADSVTGAGRIGQKLSELAAAHTPAGYKVARQDAKVSAISSRYALQYKPLTQADRDEMEASEQRRQGLISDEEYAAQDFWLRKLGDNPRKRALIFGAEITREVPVMKIPEGMEDAEDAEPVEGMETVTTTEITYKTAEESRSHMETIEIPVWRLRKGEKVPDTESVMVNAAITEEVLAIFTEIYNDPEQFPIESIGGYSWRENSKGEHIQGTAIDLNPDANYQVRDGGAMVGSHWSPGDDPYSIAVNGSVVRAFAEHGWDWGGDAWAGFSDQSYGYHDYMHFSYFGR